jgi:hypothetical protein
MAWPGALCGHATLSAEYNRVYEVLLKQSKAMTKAGAT